MTRFSWKGSRRAKPTSRGWTAWKRFSSCPPSSRADGPSLLCSEIDNRVSADARQREFRPAARQRELEQLGLPRTGDVGLILFVRAQQADAQPFQLAPGVIQQMQPRALAVAGQAGD